MNEILSAALPCWFVKDYANFICAIDIQGRELCLGDFMKSNFHTGMHSNAYELISHETWFDAC